MKQTFFLGLLGAFVSILLAAGLNDLFQAWEWKTLDFRFQLRGPIPTSPSLTLIDADDASANQYGRWPWDRTVHAEMIRLLAREKVRVAAYDILFAHPADPDGDRQLAAAVETAGNVIFPAAVSLPDNGNRQDAPDRPALPPLGTVIPDVPAARRFLSVGDSIAPLPPLVQAAQAIGHIAANRDRDGVVRRVPLLVRYGDRLVPALAFQAVMVYLEVAASSLEIGRKYILLKQAKFPDRDKTVDIRIPIDAKGQMLVNFAGRWEETFKHASFASVLSGDAGEEGEDLSGKLALVSNVLSGHDIKPVPVEKDYPGSGIHANIINTILTRNFLKETHVSFNHSLIVLLCLAASSIFRLRNSLLETGLLAGLLGAYAAGNIFLFHAGHVLPLFTPLLAIVLTALLSAIYRANAEQKISGNLLDEKRRMEAYLDSISRDLQRKEEELGKIQSLLSEMRQGIEQDRALGKAQEEKIADLQRKHQTLVEDKQKLQTERTELKNAVLDLRVHISFDEIKVEEDLRQLKEECRRFGIITQSRLVLEAFRILKQSAAVPSPILILGDSGTGKELFARAAHQMSPRRGKRFIAINMAAIPDGLVESELFGHTRGAFTGAFAAKKGKFCEADGGTFFLDEIGEIGREIQVKLLRVLQEKEVQPVGGTVLKINVRIICATNKNLREEIQRERFREDLYYRLNTITITLPALRERKEDIPVLVQHFLDRYRAEYGKKIIGISDQAMKQLMEYPWRGNIRELENVIQRGITLSDSELVREKDLGLEQEQEREPRNEPGPAEVKSGEGDGILLDALRKNRFEIKETASQLGMSRNTVASRFKGICFDLLVKHQLDREKAAREIASGSSGHELVLQRISEYHDNLIRTARDFGEEEKAVQSALKRAKNIPVQYHPAVEELVRRCFQGK